MTADAKKVRRRVFAGVGLAGLAAAGYAAWSPGVWGGPLSAPGGNAAWLEHGWLGDDVWFSKNRGGPEAAQRYRRVAAIRALRAKLTEHRVREVYAHLIPTSAAGDLPAVDHAVVERFARELHPIRVLPWIGGVVGKTAFPGDEAWIERLLGAVSALLHASSALAGVHLNLEPWLDGDTDILDVVERLRGVLPSDRRLSVAAFPPATTLIVGSTWERDYYARVTGIADQVAVMLYNTSIVLAKPYTWAVEQAAHRAIAWTEGASVILGIPTFDSEGLYHLESVENIESACAGIRGALARFPAPPSHYQGVGIYAAWETDDAEWARLAAQLNPGSTLE